MWEPITTAGIAAVNARRVDSCRTRLEHLEVQHAAAILVYPSVFRRAVVGVDSRLRLAAIAAAIAGKNPVAGENLAEKSAG